MKGAILLTLLAVMLGVLPAMAQDYRCDWNVVGIGGGDMSSTAYRCGATVGQTAAGPMSGTSFLAMIGYWQADQEVGIAEREPLQVPGMYITALHAPYPNPFRGGTTVRFTLATGSPVSLVIHDLAGRAVRTLVASNLKPGAHGVDWDGQDDAGRELARGVYFCRLSAGDVTRTGRLTLVR